jgi:hypothetical protein
LKIKTHFSDFIITITIIMKKKRKMVTNLGFREIREREKES